MTNNAKPGEARVLSNPRIPWPKNRRGLAPPFIVSTRVENCVASSDGPGRDGFHSVLDFSDKDGDAVKRVPTGFMELALWFMAHKNPMLYLEAAKEIALRYPFVKFHLLGEGTLVNEIKNYIELNNLNVLYSIKKKTKSWYKNA